SLLTLYAIDDSKNTVTNRRQVIEHIQDLPLVESERALACCTIAREKLEVGDYSGGCSLLASWWKLGEWPRQHRLTQKAAAELLLVAGTLSDAVARSSQVSGGQKWAEVLLSGAIALFEHLGEPGKAIEARIELGCCYYHQGLFEIAHSTLRSCIFDLRDQQCELKAVALIRLAIIERHSRRLHEAMTLLEEAEALETTFSAWTQGRFQ